MFLYNNRMRDSKGVYVGFPTDVAWEPGDLPAHVLFSLAYMTLVPLLFRQVSSGSGLGRANHNHLSFMGQV